MVRWLVLLDAVLLVVLLVVGVGEQRADGARAGTTVLAARGVNVGGGNPFVQGSTFCAPPTPNGQPMLLCSDFRTETAQSMAQRWGTSKQNLITNPLTVGGTPGGNEGCITAANATLSDAGLALATTAYDGGACTVTFDAGTSLTPTSWAAEVWSIPTFVPPFTYEQTILVPADTTSCSGGASPCWDPSGFLLDAVCHPHPGGATDIPSANYPPYSPGNGCVENDVSHLLREIDPWERYPQGPNGGASKFNHSFFGGATLDISPITYTGFGAFHTITEKIAIGSTTVYWDGVAQNTKSSALIDASHSYFIIMHSRAIATYTGPNTWTVQSVRVWSGN